MISLWNETRHVGESQKTGVASHAAVAPNTLDREPDPMTDAVLILNAGSSSLKFTVFQAAASLEVLLRGQIDGLPGRARFRVWCADGGLMKEFHWPLAVLVNHVVAVEFLFDWARRQAWQGFRLVAAGHRVVHGGDRFTRPVRITPAVLAELDDLAPLAPLHQPHHLTAIRAVTALHPDLPQVACFDTAFHTTQPETACCIALPKKYRDEGVRRYGFHGLSYEYIASILPAVDAAAARGRTIVAHLGNGVSLCGLQSGRSVATTMGFSTLDGAVMGTRCGSLDPGVLLYLMDRHGLSVNELRQLLYQESGLLAVSGVSSDMRELLASPDPRAAHAVDLFVYRVVREIGSLAAALGGVNALVFTGGIGENSAEIRRRIGSGCGWLGLQLDEQANTSGDRRISTATSAVAVWVLPTNEELMIAQQTLRLLTFPREVHLEKENHV